MFSIRDARLSTQKSAVQDAPGCFSFGGNDENVKPVDCSRNDFSLDNSKKKMLELEPWLALSGRAGKSLDDYKFLLGKNHGPVFQEHSTAARVGISAGVNRIACLGKGGTCVPRTRCLQRCMHRVSQCKYVRRRMPFVTS